jgi:SNF2 family DNA or RNA helicase
MLIDVQPGGGKSFTVIEEVTRLIATKKIKRPLVIMPSNLVKQWASEVAAFTGGDLRVFPITLKIWRRWMDMGFSWQQISSLIKSQPINTVFVTDYIFIRHDSAEVGVDKYNWEFYPYANFLLNQDFDYVAADESHRLKNLKSSTTKATREIMALVPHKRLASGTLISKTVADKIGQFAQINPSAIPEDRQAELFTGNKFLMSKLPLLNSAMNNYARSAIVKRREWAFLLPKIREDAHAVELTKIQREFYTKIMDEAIEEVLSDTKLMQRILSKDPDAQDAIEQA